MNKEHLEQQVKNLEEQVAEQRKALGMMESTFAQVKTALEKLQVRVGEIHQKSVTTCENCSIEFDLFAHHYSIGLFDNIVYVKCPRCNQAFPVDPKGGVKKE
jgi:uncharacterized coiled-coil protein SlyX